MSWFERLAGFRESDYRSTRERLQVVGDRLVSRVNGASYGIGSLETPSLAELRRRISEWGVSRGRLQVSAVSGNVRHMHRDPQLANALFQVASQFNLLEMVSPEVTPENGVTRYELDGTQGPACAIAAGAATIYRNYFAPVAGQQGQTADRQIDCLADVGDALGNEGGRPWTMRNGYALCSEEGLRAINAHLAGLDPGALDALRAKLRIGLHRDVEVTDESPPGAISVSQAFCSALPVAYTDVEPALWGPFARLVLEGAYEATLLAGCLNAQRTGCRLVLLTRLGGGAFGNEPEWILAAMARALEALREADLDVRVVCLGPADDDLQLMIERFR